MAYQTMNLIDSGVSNYCISDIMSYCTAGKSWKDQQPCKFAVKASTANRCMFYCEAIEGHCDSVEAQMNQL